MQDEGPAKPLRWPLLCFDELPGKSVDTAIFFNSASHVANWEHVAVQLARVLREGGRVVIAEAPLGGREFNNALHLDSQYESFQDVSTAHLREAFGARLTDVCSLEYKGWILFWGYRAS